MGWGFDQSSATSSRRRRAGSWFRVHLASIERRASCTRRSKPWSRDRASPTSSFGGPIYPCPKTASRIDLGVPGRDRRTLHTLTMDATTALAIYRAEKDKALRERRVSHVQLMAEAQEAFRKMLADAQLARKGGRPKGSTNSTPPTVTAVAAAPVAPPGKLILKKTKSAAAPTKQSEKVTLKAAAQAPASRSEKSAKAARPSKAAKPVSKRKATKSAAPAEKRVRAKASHKAAASPRKGAAKKTSPTRKQAAAHERRPKNHKR